MMCSCISDGSLFAKSMQQTVVWAFNQASEWWELSLHSFTNEQWGQNFKMSEETITCAENCIRRCVPLKKRVAIALWKLATGSEYRSTGCLFEVSITTVCCCMQDFCTAAEILLVPEQIHFPDEKFREMAAYFENRWGMPHCVGAVVGSNNKVFF